MPGTRTAPNIGGTPTFKRISIGLIDAQGDLRSLSLIGIAATTVSMVETLVAAIQDASNASIYSCTISDVYEGARSKANALNAPVVSLYSNIVYHVKASPSESQRGYVPAPLSAVFVAGTDTPDSTNTLLITIMAAVDSVVGAAAYTGVSLRYTERREINDSVPL